MYHFRAISAFVVLALTFQSALSAPGVAAPVAYAPAPAPLAAYAPAVPYNIPPFAAALNLQTRTLTAPLVAAPAYAPAPVVLPAAYAAPAGIAPAYSVHPPAAVAAAKLAAFPALV